MTRPGSTQVHATALVSPQAVLGENVTVGAYCIIEGDVRIGAGCVVGSRVHLIGPVTLGRGNTIHDGAVIGDRPQHLRFTASTSGVVIGSKNIIRESVTIHGGTALDHPTSLGDHNVLMGNSHVGHDSQIGSGCTFANGALIGGHCRIEDGVHLWGNAAVHQFCRIGRLGMVNGCSMLTKDLPCFVIVAGYNTVVGLNAAGMRRAGIGSDQIEAMGRVYDITYCDKLPVPAALTRAEDEYGCFDCVREFVDFIRTSERGISMARQRHAARRSSGAEPRSSPRRQTRPRSAPAPI